MVEAASIRRCRLCERREQCQWSGGATAKARQVSVLVHPLHVGPAPLPWRHWSRRTHRRAGLQLVRHQRFDVSLSSPATARPPSKDVVLTRSLRAHSRLCWQGRIARNARPEASGHVTILLFSLPAVFATSLGFATVSRRASLPRASLFSDTLASPSEAFWSHVPAESDFFLSFAFFALHPTGLAVSDGFPCPVLQDVRFQINDELFNKLIAHRVGSPASRPRSTSSARATTPAAPVQVIPRVESDPNGCSCVICPRRGVRSFEPDPSEWCAWVATPSSCRCVGKEGHVTAHHEWTTPRGAWRAHRQIHPPLHSASGPHAAPDHCRLRAGGSHPARSPGRTAGLGRCHVL
jgi:hypothetical protein